jgi:pimeloyl-ACP methyl ester carboxylesterase
MSVPVSEELFAPVSTEVELCYQTFGSPAGDPLLLVMGLGGPMTWWDTELCTMLAEAGFHVVRFDNRDTGRSSRIRARVTRSQLMQAVLGRGGRAPYTLNDMAADAFGLMDHLGWDSAHVAGISMGGMIVQTMAIDQPGRVRSLTSIMSTLGKRSVGWQHPSLLPMLIAKRAPGREAYVASSVRTWQLIGSPAFPLDEVKGRARAEETFDRGVSASGVMRQMLAVLNQPNRSAALGALRIPVAVVHGAADKMVHVSGGRATARAIPGAELLVIDGLGHDMPSELFGTLTDIIRRTADRATRGADADHTA